MLRECAGETSGPFISLFKTISMSLPFLPSSFVTITIYPTNLFMSILPAYPRDHSLCMRKEGPVDRHFHIPSGRLQYNPERDARFPYIYEIPTHTLMHSLKYITTILIHVVDTSLDPRVKCAKFGKSLSIPLGPDDNMDHHGSFGI